MNAAFPSNRFWHRIWRPLMALGLAIVLTLVAPGTLPIGIFAILLSLFGESIAVYFMASAFGVLFAIVFPHLPFWHADEYVNATGSLCPNSAFRFFANPIDEVIVGLFFLNAFFTLFTNNRFFQDTFLPWLRWICGTIRKRLFMGWLLGLCCFSDDAATGAIINRLYKPDIASPGVDEKTKQRFLLFILILANAFAAVVPLSSWGAFYSTLWEGFEQKHVLFCFYPIVSILVCLLYSFRGSDGKGHKSSRPPVVLDVDFYQPLETPRTRARPPWWQAVLFLLPLGLAIALLARWPQDWKGGLLISFVCALAALIVVLAVLQRVRGWSEETAATKGFREAADHLESAARSLGAERASVFSGPAAVGESSRAPARAIPIARVLERAGESVRAAQQEIESIDPIPQEHPFPPVCPTQPWRFLSDVFLTREIEGHLKYGIKEITSGLIRVYFVLVIAEVVKVCLGQPLGDSAFAPATQTALDRDSLFLSSIAINKMDDFHPSAIAIVFGFFLCMFLLALRALRFSSAWGILGISFPLVLCVGERLFAEPHWAAILPVAFGLIVSFGVWANQTLPAGDNVAIAAEIQERDADGLCKISREFALWPLGLCALVSVVLMALVAAFANTGAHSNTSGPLMRPHLLPWIAFSIACLIAVVARIMKPPDEQAKHSPY